MGKPKMTPKTGIKAPLPWDYAVQDIPQAGLSTAREATPDELASVASALDLIVCASLKAEYTIASTAAGHYRLSGRLRAQVSQACVVTLDPVDSTIEDTFEAVFWPPQDMPAPESGAVALDDEPEREPIAAGQIAVGRIVFESLAAAIDPFPRTPGAVLEWQHSASTDAPAGKPTNPFAVLANLKTKG